MASLQQQNIIIKYEKANAMRRFQMNKRIFEIMFHLFNICATLFLFSHSSCFPITLQAFCNAYAVLIPLFNNPFYAFLFLNAIIFFIYSLSNKNGGVSSGEAYDQFLNTTASETVNDPVESSPEKQRDEIPDRVVVRGTEVGESSPVFAETVTAVTETTTMTTKCCTTVTTNGGAEKVSEEKCYRRVQSESYERRLVAADPRRELKRFSTGVKREPQTRLCYVEELSKEEEEFQRACEDFIAKQLKRMQLEEQIGSQKTEYLAIAP